MATAESILKEIQELSPEERKRLQSILDAETAPSATELQRLRNRLVHEPVPPTPEELATIRTMLDRTGAEIAAAWKSNKSALEAVQEQRREL